MRALAFALAFVAAYLCSGCNDAADLLGEPLDPIYVEAVEYGWEGAGLPALDDCDLDRSRVLRAEDAKTFARLCGWPVEVAAACLTQYTAHERGIVWGGYPLVVLRPGQPDHDTQGEPILHELFHWAIGCALDRRSPDTQDSGHTDERVWLHRGGPNSAQGIARAWIRERLNE